MELLAQIAHRCLRTATRAVRTRDYCSERSDQRGVASANADLFFAGAVARAAVSRLHHHQRRGEIDDMTAARIGIDLVKTLRLVTTPDPALVHTNGVMAIPTAAPYDGSDVAETVRDSDRVSHAPTPDRSRPREPSADV